MKFPRLMVFFGGRGPCFGGRRTVANSGTPCVRERTAAHIGLAIPGYVQLGVDSSLLVTACFALVLTSTQTAWLVTGAARLPKVAVPINYPQPPYPRERPTPQATTATRRFFAPLVHQVCKRYNRQTVYNI